MSDRIQCYVYICKLFKYNEVQRGYLNIMTLFVKFLVTMSAHGKYEHQFNARSEPRTKIAYYWLSSSSNLLCKLSLQVVTICEVPNRVL